MWLQEWLKESRADFSIQGQASPRQSDHFPSKSNHLLEQPLSLSCTWTCVSTALLLSSWLEVFQVLSVLPHPFHDTRSTRERKTWKGPSRREPGRETGQGNAILICHVPQYSGKADQSSRLASVAWGPLGLKWA